MKKTFSLLALSALGMAAYASPIDFPGASQADSAYLFSYNTGKDMGRNGLHFAWSTDGYTWHEIGPEWAPVKSDYGAWGVQKRMLDPIVKYNPRTNLWEACWRVNEEEDVMAFTSSKDMVLWKPQDYNHAPASLLNGEGVVRETIELPSGTAKGQVHRVAWSLVKGLIDAQRMQQVKDRENSERAIDDKTGRFRDLKSQLVKITVNESGQKQISDKLIGIFFEDINYGADGGLYGELLQNRDFEYSPRDNRGNDPEKWQPTSWWKAENAALSIDTQNPIHENNPHYAVLKAEGTGAKLANLGWEGIPVKAGAKYDFSLFGRLAEGANGKVKAQLVSKEGNVLAEAFVSLPKGNNWKKINVVMKAKAACDEAQLVLQPMAAGTYHFDMVSLFPQDTYKGRKNGMRKDMAETLEALHPQFMRFPGGCASHGDGLDNMYRWKNTIGPLEARKPNWNIWNYHQTVGLGFFEYFQLCEDMGARPLPVLAAGVPCQNSCVGGNGQHGGIPMEQMDEYIQELIDLIDYANGDPKTNKWAKMRAEAGHPKPFNLTMLGVGNEDLISDVFTERYKMICEKIHKVHPEIEIVGTVGPFYEGSDYEYGWKLAREMELPYVDEHYYNSPGWFVNNQDFYDRYARTVYNSKGEPVAGTQVYLGEYASHIWDRTNCIETALSEALYLCSVERNADVVAMTSYAPLFAKKGHTQWNPDLIYFTNTTVEPTSGYQVQKLFGQNTGTVYMPSVVRLENPNGKVQKRIGSSVVVDSKTGDLIVKLVNYLPVANKFEVELPAGCSGIREAQVLTGELADTRAVPAPFKGATLDAGKLSLEAPAYSFVVIRIQR
ncbi:MAG: alpha-L-arabinofuranosidase C-terminal domain-containing protein [Bacteroidales bacterium]|nr:alpha-L-arabinofuranosidase C-terminal domain-containing protein [Bacteroidales bacterium]